jgi:hypothetical protein
LFGGFSDGTAPPSPVSAACFFIVLGCFIIEPLLVVGVHL